MVQFERKSPSSSRAASSRSAESVLIEVSAMAQVPIAGTNWIPGRSWLSTAVAPLMTVLGGPRPDRVEGALAVDAAVGVGAEQVA
jgi:hypothetical protein